jgi:hypothetical protein
MISSMDDGLHLVLGRGEGYFIENLPFLLERSADDHPEHELVHLRFSGWVPSWLDSPWRAPGTARVTVPGFAAEGDRATIASSSADCTLQGG